MPIETRFKDSYSDDFIMCESDIEFKKINLIIYSDCDYIEVCLDIPTAIKLSKTIRTHINKVKGV